MLNKYQSGQPNWQTSKFSKLLVSHKTARAISIATRSDPDLVWRTVKALRRKIRKWIQSEGLENLCSRIKTAEKQFLLGQPSSWVSLKHFGYGKVSDECVKTLLTIHRNMKTSPKPDFRSIAHVGTEISTFLSEPRIRKAFEKVCKTRLFRFPQGHEMVRRVLGPDWELLPGGGYRHLPDGKPNYDHLFTFEYPPVDSNGRSGGLSAPMRINSKSGPNGPSLGTQAKDLCALKHTAPHLLEPIKRFWTRWGFQFDENQYETVTHELQCPYTSRKLLALQDKSCKTRIVATLDSYSQIALRPVHRMLSLVLGKFRTDFTHDHQAGVDYLRTVGGELFSIDLSNATDTLPVDLGLALLQRQVDPALVPDPEQFVKDLKSLLTGAPFTYEKEKVSYRTGQPMGAYSSFPLLAMTNHLLVAMARVLAGFKPSRRSYAIVGDDVVISGRKIADNYIALLNALGVPINHRKVVIGHGTFEFCRRRVRDKVVQSVPSWNVLYQACRTGDPTPYVTLRKSYGMEPLPYSELVRIFERRHVRNMLSLREDLHLPGEPHITRIPHKIVAHADRVLGILDKIKNPLKPFVSDDPYLKRLLYESKVRPVYASCFKKYKPWLGVLRAKANSFYLGYIDTYLDMRKTRSRVYNSMSEKSRTSKIRRLCMTKRSQWPLIEHP